MRRGRQSAITSVISTTLIWPNAKFEVMGSSQIAAGATIATASQNRRNQAGPGSSAEVFQTSRPLSTITVETISSTSVNSGDRDAGRRHVQPRERAERDGRQRGIGERQISPMGVWN